MVAQENKFTYGLLGKNISYSFSKEYFSKKFKTEKIINSSYLNFDIPSLQKIDEVFSTPNLKGLNVTIPYKESIIPYLDSLDKVAKDVNAVNTIKIKDNKRIGYNTDVVGFENSLKKHLKKQHRSALILGTGGASKAIEYVLNKLGISFMKVSRTPSKTQFSYNQLEEQILSENKLIINCTPLGTFPNVLESPPLDYTLLSSKHLLYDLIYNPLETQFLKKGKEHGAFTKNGLEMLELQAEASWDIWNS